MRQVHVEFGEGVTLPWMKITCMSKCLSPPPNSVLFGIWGRCPTLAPGASAGEDRGGLTSFPQYQFPLPSTIQPIHQPINLLLPARGLWFRYAPQRAFGATQPPLPQRVDLRLSIAKHPVGERAAQETFKRGIFADHNSAFLPNGPCAALKNSPCEEPRPHHPTS